MRFIFSVIILILMISGCATITRGRSLAFTVTSEPAGADIRLSSGLTCTTPCTLTVPRRPGFVVTASKEGYATITTNVVSSVANAGAAGLAGNVLLGGLIGVGVDASTGAMNDITPNPLHLVFEDVE